MDSDIALVLKLSHCAGVPNEVSVSCTFVGYGSIFNDLNSNGCPNKAVGMERTKG